MKSTQRIGLLLALVFLLPALFFSVYEISSLTKDEKMIQDIYQKQLEAILFSVNQYSDDVLNNWISHIEGGLAESTEADSVPRKIKTIFGVNAAIVGVFVSDTVDQNPVLQFFSPMTPSSKSVDPKLILLSRSTRYRSASSPLIKGAVFKRSGHLHSLPAAQRTFRDWSS